MNLKLSLYSPNTKKKQALIILFVNLQKEPIKKVPSAVAFNKTVVDPPKVIVNTNIFLTFWRSHFIFEFKMEE